MELVIRILSGMAPTSSARRPPPPGMARGYVAEIMVTWPIVLDAAVLALVTTFVASVLPAWRASRMNIVVALRRAR